MKQKEGRMEEARGTDVWSPAVVPTGDPAPAPGARALQRRTKCLTPPVSSPNSCRADPAYTTPQTSSVSPVGGVKVLHPMDPLTQETTVKVTTFCSLPQSQLSVSEPFPHLNDSPFSSATKALITRLLWSKGQFGSHVSTSAPEARKCSQKHCRAAAAPECHPSPTRGSDEWGSRLKSPGRDFPGDPGAKNPPSSVGVVGSIPVQELRPQMQLRSNRGKSINKIQPTQRASWSRCSWASSKRQEHTCSKTGNRVTRKVSSALIRL